MGSPAPRIDVLYRATTSGYETSIGLNLTMHMHGCLTRRELVETIVDYVRNTKNERTLLRVWPNYSMGPDEKYHWVSKRTVARIVVGTVGAEELCIGELTPFLELQMRRAVSRLVPTRAIPGTDGLIECVYCGRGAHKAVCQTCGRIMSIHNDKFRGPCLDLVEAAEVYSDVDRFFVNQPWNPNPPWLSREDLFQLLEEN